MATYTREQLRNRVLGRLGVLDPSEAPESFDSDAVLEQMQQTLEELYADGLVPFDIEGDEIPAAYMTALSYVVAHPMMTDYGVSGERSVQIEAGYVRGMKRLWKLKSQPYFGTAQQAVYY
jgi:hypothetical protein